MATGNTTGNRGYRRDRPLAAWLIALFLALPGLAGAELQLKRLDHHAPHPPPVHLLPAGQVLDASRPINLGLSSRPVWLHLEISAPPPRVLHLDNPLLHDVRLLRVDSAGDLHWAPVPRRTMARLGGGSSEAWRPIFDVTPGQYLLRIESTQALRFDLRLQSPEALVGDWRAFTLAQGLFLGLVLALAAYNTILLFRLRDASYLWYVGFILGLAGYFVFQKGLTHEFWPGLGIALNEALMFTALSLGCASAMWFCRRFLMTEQRDPAMDRLLPIAALCSLALAPLAWGLPGHATLLYASAIGLLAMASYLFATARAIRDHDFPPARWLLLAWLVMVVGALLFTLAGLGLVPHHFVTYYGFQIGVSLQAVLLSLALADRIGLLQAEREALLNEQAQLRLTAYTDGLTGLYNRRYLDEFLARAVEDAERRQRELAVVMLDLDDFKPFNDRWGHQVGDRALQHLAYLMQEVVRGIDPVCRYGGEEFLLILPDRGLKEAEIVGRRLLTNLASRPMTGPCHPPLTLTATAGATAHRPGDNAARLLERADAALYEGKRAGKNRLVTAA